MRIISTREDFSPIAFYTNRNGSNNRSKGTQKIVDVVLQINVLNITVVVVAHKLETLLLRIITHNPHLMVTTQLQTVVVIALQVI